MATVQTHPTEFPSRRALPDGTTLHLHQLVVDDEGETFVVTGLDAGENSLIKLAEITPPVESDEPGFGRSYLLTSGDCAEHGTPQVAPGGDESIPVFAY